MNKRTWKTAVTLIALLASAGTANAQVTLTGAEIVNGSYGTFHNGSPSVVGNSFQITTAFSANSLVYDIPLIPAGELSTGDDVSLSVQISMTRISADNDPLWGVADGNLTTRVSYFAFDGADHAISWGGFDTGPGQFNTGSNFSSMGPCNGSCGTSVSSNYTIDLTFTQAGNGNASLAQTTTEGANTATTSYNFPLSFDVADGLSLVLARQSSDEEYQINAITFGEPITTITTPEPVPATGKWGLIMLVLSMLLIGTMLISHKRRRGF